MLLLLVTLVIGQSLLALSIEWHARLISPALPRDRKQFARLGRYLRGAGGLVLGASVAVAVNAFGWGLGLTLWFGTFTLMGLALALAFATLEQQRQTR